MPQLLDFCFKKKGAQRVYAEDCSMKVETLQDLIDWTRQTHQHLSQCLESSRAGQRENEAKELLQYLADHEKALVRAVEQTEKEAAPEVLKTWVRDYVGETPIDPHLACLAPYGNMNADELIDSIVDVHNQVIDLYRYLFSRADSPEARGLAENLLSLEEHAAMLLAEEEPVE